MSLIQQVFEYPESFITLSDSNVIANSKIIPKTLQNALGNLIAKGYFIDIIIPTKEDSEAFEGDKNFKDREIGKLSFQKYVIIAHPAG